MGVLTRKFLGLLAGLLMMILLLPCVIAPPSAQAETVSYLDENGITQTQEIDAVIGESTEMTAYGASSGDTWLLARGNVERARLVFNGNVNLVLEDNCKLTVNGGILIKKNLTLSIYAQSTGSQMGSLVAIGGDNPISAGIGANNGNDAGNIAIHGGKITASATKGTQGTRAACIGGCAKRTCGNITITGGVVTADGNQWPAANIGSGSEGSVGNIVISGGYVNAVEGAIGIWKAQKSACGDITITNGAFVQAKTISNKSKTSEWNGIVFEESSGTVYGDSVAPLNDFEIESGKTLTISVGQILTINKGITATIASGGVIANNGVIRIMQDGKLDVNGTLNGSNSHAVILDVDDSVDLGSTPQRSYGETVTMPTGITKTGHTLIGWFESGTDTKVIEFSEATDSDKTYYLQWSINQYTISFDSDGGSNVNSITQDYDTEVAPPADPTRTGYTFKGWDKAIPVRMPADNLKLTAKWTPNTNTAYKVEHWQQNTARDGYDRVETDDLTGTTDTTATAAGKGYEGFSLNSSAGSSKASGNITGDGSLTLKLYYDRNVYGVTLNANGGTINDGDVKSYVYGVGATLPCDVTKAGYTFEGWYDNESFEGNKIGSVTKGETGSKAFYAKWTPNSYTVQFKGGAGAKGSMGSQLFTYDQAQALTPNTFTREGYSFAGWQDSDGNNYTNAQEVKNLTMLADATVTLAAQWTADPSVISFESNGGSSVAAMTGVTDEDISDRTLPTLTRHSHSFLGWYDNKGLKGEPVKQLPEVFPVGGTTYYAKWQYYCIHTPEDMAAVAPTCTEPGLTEGSKCSACGQILKAQEQLPALGHEWGDWVVTKKASVLEEGVETATCTHEGCQTAQTRTIGKLDTTTIKSKGISYSFDGETVVVTGVDKGKTKVTIPATVKIEGVSYAVTEIAPYAFKDCKKLAKFVVGDNIVKIGKGAFQGCKKLKSVAIGKNVKTIGKVAFKDCKNLTSITVTSKHLTKKQVKGSLKGSKVKTVIVKVGSVKANKTYAKKYAKIFTKKICGKKVKVMASKMALK